MPSMRIGILLLPPLLMTACAVAETAPPAITAEPLVAAPPVDTVVPRPPAPAAEAQPSLQERWRAPFAVVSRGRPMPREERRVFVRADSAPAPAAVVAEAVPAESAAAAPAAPAAEARPARRAEVSRIRTHKVEWGETWYGLARRYEVSAAALAAANPEVNPERLRSGQVLRIPVPTGAAAGRRTHKVGAGDSLWGIARRYGVTMEQIRRANGLQNDRVRLGQTLVIPRAEEGG
jgi:LysM repeat protein